MAKTVGIPKHRVIELKKKRKFHVFKRMIIQGLHLANQKTGNSHWYIKM